MSATVMKYVEMLQKMKRVKIYDALSETITNVSFLGKSESETVYVSFVTKEKIIEKTLTIAQLEDALVNSKKYKCINIDTNDCHNDIYDVIGNVSKRKGIFAPFVEANNNIMYFPKLRYSDVGLLRHICDMEKVGDYKLLMASSC